MKKIWSLLLFMAISLTSLCFASSQQDKEFMTQSESQVKSPVVLFKTTAGDIKVELNAEKAPITVKNFIQYVNDGHYNNTIFHRVIDGFMIQGGGFTKDFQQKPTRPTIQIESDNGLKNTIGTLAMARTSDPNSASSQFFINVADNDFLNFRGKNVREYGYAVFGKVIEGMDVVNSIKKVKTSSKGPHENVPVQPIEILSAEVISQ